jgi:undecaprenyl-diphosphatase
MTDDQTVGAIVLGIVEGLTEFLPVSSTGHMILIGDLLGFQGPPGRVFEIVIQLGAILAICLLYAGKLTRIAIDLPTSASARRFVFLILLAFLPALVLGATLHGFIKSVLFSPWVVSIALIVGGIAILIIERMRPAPKYTTIEEFTPAFAFKVGLCQTIAMIPGVSRSGATILGAVLLGAERRTAAEFSFILAIPTMLAATVYDLYKNWSTLDFAGSEIILIGFVFAFITALVVVRAFLAYIGRHGFAPFGWYRIVIGSLMLVFLFAR